MLRILSVILASFIVIMPAFADFKTFDDEVAFLEKGIHATECKLTAASPEFEMGRLYGCLHPQDRSVKLWVNEDFSKPNRFQ